MGKVLVRKVDKSYLLRVNLADFQLLAFCEVYCATNVTTSKKKAFQISIKKSLKNFATI